MGQDFEWDEAKRLTNFAKHRLDFRDADLLFDGSHFRRPARSVANEVGWLATGKIGDVFVTAVFSWRVRLCG